MVVSEGAARCGAPPPHILKDVLLVALRVVGGREKLDPNRAALREAAKVAHQLLIWPKKK